MPENVFILREISNIDANNIIAFYRAKSGNAGYITTLKLKIDINSIQEANFPAIPDDTPPDVLEAILEEVALNTPSKQIKIFFRKLGGSWIERAPMQIFNKDPYYDVSLIRLFSDASTIDCSDDMELGLQIVPGLNNQLAATDKILIWGTSIEEEIVSNKICGEIIAFAGTQIPQGWLTCNGSEQPIAIYPRLAQQLGTLWGTLTNGAGAGGTTHFRLPDLRGRSPIGAGAASGLTARTIGQTLGAENHTLTATEMPLHSHTQNPHTHVQDTHNHTQNAHAHQVNWFAGANAASSLTATGGVLTPTANVAATTSVAATNVATIATNQTTTATNIGTGGGLSHNNMQPSAVVTYLIYAGQ